MDNKYGNTKSLATEIENKTIINDKNNKTKKDLSQKYKVTEASYEQSESKQILEQIKLSDSNDEVKEIPQTEITQEVKEIPQTEINQEFDQNKLSDITHELEQDKHIQIVNDMTMDDIFINLNLISKIDVGNKLYINGKYINIDIRYVQPLLRWFYGDDRKSTLNFLKLVINKSFEFCDMLVKNDLRLLFRLTNDLKNSISGLTKLKQTYLIDKLVQAEIDVIIEDIRTKIDSNLTK
jgi:hypothetical protein